MLLQTTGKRMGQIVRFELDEQDAPAPQTQVQLPASSPINLTDEEERMSRDSNAEIRQKAHQVLESLMSGNERFRKVCRRAQWALLLHMHSCQCSKRQACELIRTSAVSFKLAKHWPRVGVSRFSSDVQGVFERCQPDLELMEEVQAPSAQTCLILSTVCFSCAGMMLQ